MNGPEIPSPPPAVAEMFPHGQLGWWVNNTSAHVRAAIFRALRPFALMHRLGSDSKEVACMRGAASDMTVVTSADFEAAFNLLLELGDADFADQISEDVRYDPAAFL
jgi:hypothetical protein